MKAQLISSPRLLSDRELIDRVKDLACREGQVTACLVAHLAELEERQLHVAEGCASIFTYCTEVLHLSEHAAYHRIEAARASVKFPRVLEKLADGSLHLTAVRLLAPHLTENNHRDLLEEATHKTARQVDEIVARIRPRQAVASSVRRLPARSAGTASSSSDGAGAPTLDLVSGDIESRDASESAGNMSAGVTTGEVPSSRPQPRPSSPPQPRPAKVAPLAPDLYSIHFTADAETHTLLCRARELLRHQIPDGDAAAVIGLALKVLVGKLAKQKFAAAGRNVKSNDRVQPGGKANSRHIPAEVRRQVWNRDQGRCAFVARSGRRCSERGMLEFHHVRPFARGGRASVENIQLRCRAHNQHEAELCFGPAAAAPLSRGELVLRRVENVMSSSP